jgi:23S rRNA (cytidine1920-2'-O)/16S rRNA (cytidine1409-2'-O)-methyltransferase
MIEEGLVTVGGLPTSRPATLVEAEASVAVVEQGPRFVSRGGLKLDGALRTLSVEVNGRTWLDAGASTGGFTDRLLQGGARGVIAVDVGYGQLDWKLRNDRRVIVLERTNVRRIDRLELPWAPEGVVADLSFISLRVVLPGLASVARPDADHVLLVKPQFESGRAAVGKGGVVRDPAAWQRALEAAVEAGEGVGLGLIDAVVAEPPGPAGNREFFVHLRRGASGNKALLRTAVEEARG